MSSSWGLGLRLDEALECLLSSSDRSMLTGYSDNLAQIHEEGFTSIARTAATMLVRELRRGGLSEGLIVDVGCGGGTLGTLVIESGYDVFGIDISASMIRLARQREPRGRYRRQSWTEAAIPPCAGIVAAGECLSYRFGERPTDRQFRSFLRRAYASLVPGGILLFDILETLPYPESREGWVEDPEGRWIIHVKVAERPRSGVVVRKITSFRRIGRLYERTVEVHEQRRYDAAKVERALGDYGFKARKLNSYGRRSFRAGQIGFLARKPTDGPVFG